jgi:hypothetical protein
LVVCLEYDLPHHVIAIHKYVIHIPIAFKTSQNANWRCNEPINQNVRFENRFQPFWIFVKCITVASVDPYQAIKISKVALFGRKEGAPDKDINNKQRRKFIYLQ